MMFLLKHSRWTSGLFLGGLSVYRMTLWEPRVIYSRFHGEEIVVRAKVKWKLCSIVKECDVYRLVFNLKNTYDITKMLKIIMVFFAILHFTNPFNKDPGPTGSCQKLKHWKGCVPHKKPFQFTGPSSLDSKSNPAVVFPPLQLFLQEFSGYSF